MTNNMHTIDMWGKTQVGLVVGVGQKVQICVKVNNVLPKGFFNVYQSWTKWLWNPYVEKLARNIMGMGMHSIVKQMGKIDSRH